MFRRTGKEVNFVEGRDIRMEDLLPLQRPYCPSEVRDNNTQPPDMMGPMSGSLP